MLLVDFGCGLDAGDQTALKSWVSWKNNSLLRSNREWLQDVVVEVAAAGASTYGCLVQEDTKDDLFSD